MAELMNYLNRKLITAINQLKTAAASQRLTLAQTNSKLDGKYLKSVRLYTDPEHKGRPNLAVWTGHTLADIEQKLSEHINNTKPSESI